MSEQALAAGLDQKVIPSNGKRRALFNILFAIVWNGFVFSMIYFVGDELLKTVQKEPIFWVFSLFPIVGIYMIYSSIGDAIDWFKFGEAPLTLNTNPAYVGGNLSGYVEIDIPHEHGLNAEVSLSCSHYYIEKTRKNETSHRTDVLWQDDLLMPSQPQAGKTRVLFSFKIDEGLPQTQGKGSKRHEWNVSVKLPVAGKNFVRTYIVSVDKRYAMDSSGSAAAPLPVQPLLAEHQSAVEVQQGAIKTTHKIPKITTSHSGQHYFYPASRHLILGICFLIGSLIFGAMAVSMLRAFADFLPTASILFSIPLVIVTVALLLVGLAALLHRLEVIVSRVGITVKHRFPLYTFLGELKPSEIADIQVSRNGSASSTGGASKVWYKLKVIDMNGLETTVGDSLEGSSYAKSIRQQMVDGLGHGWEPTEVVKQLGKMEKLRGLRKSSRFSWVQALVSLLIGLAVAYDLYNRFKFGGE